MSKYQVRYNQKGGLGRIQTSIVKENFSVIMRKSLFYILFSIVFLFISCLSNSRPNSLNPTGKYSTTPSHGGSNVSNGYIGVEIRSDRTCMVWHEGDVYANYGNWKKTDNGITIFGVTGDFSEYNGTYLWTEHIHGKKVGEKGQILEKSNNEIRLYPLPKYSDF